MQEQVAERKADIRARGEAGGSDAFSMLVKASEDEGGKYKLDDTELASTPKFQFMLIYKLQTVDRKCIYHAVRGAW